MGPRRRFPRLRGLAQIHRQIGEIFFRIPGTIFPFGEAVLIPQVDF